VRDARDVDGQLAFDIEGMIHAAQVEAAPPWTGAPLHFTVDYFSPDDLDAAWAHWKFLHQGVLGAYALSKMWHRAIAVPGGIPVGDHGFDMFTADLRCLADEHRHAECACIGDLLYQSVCEPCGWHAVGDSENGAAESWHDHAIPGWRDLPIVPISIPVVDSNMRITRQVRAWVEEHYPEDMQFPGAPIITERRGVGHRHVPGRSPWAGYDISHTAVDPDRKVAPPKSVRRRQTHRQPGTRHASSAPSGMGLGD